LKVERQLAIGNRQLAIYPARVSILEELKWRGLLADCTDAPELAKKVSTPITLYCGFDPTADSLHVGNLVPLLALRRFQMLGHHPIAVAGGATGMVGDPSGKTQERQLLTKEVLERNIASVKEQLKRLLDFDTKTNPARLVDNASWTANVSYLDFLRDIGKHFSVNQMVAKESIRARMEGREVGISYTEFSYMLLQAFDFLVLYEKYGCELQIGGSDQWGNITAGIDLIRKKLGKTAYGLTLPLITNADGTKFGKTEAGAVWLDPKKTSVYRFYQFWINTDDRDVIRYLKYFTFLSKEAIESLEKKHAENPGAREAHKALAKAATDSIHGEGATREAIKASEALFGGSLDQISEAALDDVIGFSDAVMSTLFAKQPTNTPWLPVRKSRFQGQGTLLVDLLVLGNLVASKSDARRKIQEGAIYVNNLRETNAQRSVTFGDLKFGRHLLLRKGKKNYICLVAIEDHRLPREDMG
jgi:tyrosyl-tRNA synthetase